jgi:hypothetical protein
MALTGTLLTPAQRDGIDQLQPGTDPRVGGASHAIGVRLSEMLSSVSASAAHTNTTTEAIFDENYTIAKDTLKAGTVIKVRYQGIATATNSTDTLTITLRIGGLAGTAIITTAAVDVANNHIFAGEATIAIRTSGASGTLVAIAAYSDPGAQGGAVVNKSVASTAVDTTASQQIAVTADWSVANAGNSCRLDLFVVEVLQSL